MYFISEMDMLIVALVKFTAQWVYFDLELKRTMLNTKHLKNTGWNIAYTQKEIFNTWENWKIKEQFTSHYYSTQYL